MNSNKIQELENLEDLQALIDRDVINAHFKGTDFQTKNGHKDIEEYSGKVLLAPVKYNRYKKDMHFFIRKQEDLIIGYYVPLRPNSNDFSIASGKLVQTEPFITAVISQKSLDYISLDYELRQSGMQDG